MDKYRPICTSKDGMHNWRAVMQLVPSHTTIEADAELWVKESDVESLLARVRELEAMTIIEDFVQEVESRAEQKMLITGKLEGAHYAAMKQILAERQALKGGE